MTGKSDINKPKKKKITREIGQASENNRVSQSRWAQNSSFNMISKKPQGR
jgi:hypothetical protein